MLKAIRDLLRAYLVATAIVAGILAFVVSW